MNFSKEDKKVLSYFQKRRSRTGDHETKLTKFEGYIARLKKNKIVSQTIQTLLDPAVANRGERFYAGASALGMTAEAFAKVLMDSAKSKDKLALHHYLKPFVGNLAL